MVGVVGSSPIEPTNEIRKAGLPVFQAARNTPTGVKGEYGYDTANVDRNNFGATLVEDLFRPVSVSAVNESECGPSKAGPHFFCRPELALEC